jgi:hypothetical protein
MATHSKFMRQPAGAMPGRVRLALFVGVGLALAGALYLVWLRGEPLLLDLESLGRVFCF